MTVLDKAIVYATKFHVNDKAKQKWYYCGIAERLNKVQKTNAFKEFEELLFAVFGI